MRIPTALASGGDHATLDAALDRLTGAAPPKAREPPEFRRILAAVDETNASLHVLAWAGDVARAFRADLTVATVRPSATVPIAPLAGLLPGGIPESESDRRFLDASVTILREKGVHARSQLLEGPPVAAIVDAARLGGHDLVVVGAHNDRGLAERLMLGSVSRGVKDHVAASVLIARSPPPPPAVVLGTDGSAQSRRATDAGLALARAWGTPSTVVHVETHPSGYFEHSAGRVGDIELVHESGPPAQRLLAVARGRGAGLVVVGSRGLRRMRTLVTGSVSDHVARESPVSVLIVKAVSSE